jgi:CTP:molybdopterin cytidylyltransferase MocA
MIVAVKRIIKAYVSYAKIHIVVMSLVGKIADPVILRRDLWDTVANNFPFLWIS